MKALIGVVGLWALLAVTAPAHAAMGGSASEPAPSGDPDYTAGRAAFDRQDWPGVISHMTEVVRRRPWHDDAYNALGFAYRKQGDYGRALRAYHRALRLNPHHRQALEYLGEAYLELDQPDRAVEVLARLRAACLRVEPDQGRDSPGADCEEWQDLHTAIGAYESTASRER